MSFERQMEHALMEQVDIIDRLKAELEEAYTELAISIKERIDLGNKLAEARAEVERLKEEIRHYEDQGLWIPDKAEQDRREGWEQGKESSQRTIQQLEAMNKALMEQLTKGVSMQPTPIMIANADAHRMGWEQCQAEAEDVALRYEQKVYEAVGDPRVGNFTGRVARLIAAMEYGGKAND